MSNSTVMVKEERSEFESKENSMLCLTSTSQNLCTSFAEIDSDVEKRAMIPAIEAPSKTEPVMSGCERISNDHRNGVKQMTSAHDWEEKTDWRWPSERISTLEGRIGQLERVLSEINQGKIS